MTYNDEYRASCPACGDPIDYCQGHGEIGDPTGAAILAAHDNDDHISCHPMGCDAALEREMVGDDLGTPGSRWGSHASDCWPIARRVAEIVADATGEGPTLDDYDHAMGLVVNDHDDVVTMLAEYGDDDDVRALLDVTSVDGVAAMLKHYYDAETADAFRTRVASVDEYAGHYGPVGFYDDGSNDR